MVFEDKIQLLSNKVVDMDKPLTEEATKTALIMPFIQSLGYDVHNLNEVVPEYVSDVGIKKGEKVDYAIMKDGKPIMFFECKSVDSNLDNKEYLNQLYRYFSVSDVKIAVLTNGILYRFYSDLKDTNRMDERPFLEIDLTNIEKGQINELKLFCNDSFNIEDITSVANELRYTKEIIRLIKKELNNPSNEFIVHFAKPVYSKKITPKVREQFRDVVKRAFKSFIDDKLRYMVENGISQDGSISEDGISPGLSEEEQDEEKDGIITTAEEIEGFHIVRAILYEILEIKRVVMRDTKSYCGILLDDNNRKPICRLHFNTKQKYLGIFDDKRNEQRIPIDKLSDIYKYATHIRKTIKLYDSSSNNDKKPIDNT